MRKISIIAVVICKNAYTVVMRKSQKSLSSKLIDIRKIISIISKFLLEVLQFLGVLRTIKTQRKNKEYK